MFAVESVRSLGGRTDLQILSGQGARISPREDYLLVESPGNPGFFWGNFLYFRSAPAAGDLARWESLFRYEFRLAPDVRHVTFGWDGEKPGELAPFEAAGYQYDPATVLTLTAEGLERPERAYPGLEVRELSGDAGWAAMVRHQVACRPEGFERSAYEAFKSRQAAAYRSMAEAGHGSWWGGHVNGSLVADCGLFFFDAAGKPVGRFQSVGTHPDWRRRGICGALIHGVSQWALAKQPGATLVMAAATGEPAERIYRQVGYRPWERQHGLCRRPFKT